jgi:hypothetical protein
MRLRTVSAVLAAALAIGGLSACQTKVGQAAIVGSDRISETDLGKYVTREGPSAQARSAAAAQNQTLGTPKVEALTTIIQTAVFAHALASTGGMPSAARLAQLHDEAAQRLLGASTTGDAFDAGLIRQARSYGFTETFGRLAIRSAELEDALIDRVKASQLSDLLAVIKKYPVHVSVSPRYGSWEPAKLALSDSVGAGLPSFVTFGPGAIAGTDATNTTG